MKAFEEFKNQDASFWAFVKFVSEKLGYTDKNTGNVKQYTFSKIHELCSKYDVNATDKLINDVVLYSKLRADILSYASTMLMNGDSAKKEYHTLYQEYRAYNYLCKIPYNKQKGEMKQVAFFTAIINIITEKIIRQLTGNNQLDKPGFDDDPRGLSYVWDENRNIIGASSRRFDGAYPSTENPKIVWEIKEYYYATTFGSRVADGVYETQLDGFEFKELFERTKRKVYHVLFIDAYQTWWVQGKSYLCRLVDALNSGVVDEVIVGKEVFERWPVVLSEIING